MAGVTWYAFDFKDYASDTARLSCEGHGAYIQLIMDYYNTKQPIPDDDFILAAVTKLPIETWKQHRKVLARYFTIADGVWRHDRIDREIKESCEKHAASIAAAKAGAAARWAKDGDKPDRSTSLRSRGPVKGQKNAASNAGRIAEAPPAQSAAPAELHLHPLITGGGEAPPAEVDDLDSVGTPIPRDFTPDPATSDRAKAAGLEVAEIDAEVRKFIGTRQADGSFSNDWQGSFAVWIEREIQHRAKQKPKAPPRIEVNAAPTDAEYDRGCEQFRKGQQWSRQLGPDPDSGGCRVPLAILEKHGLRKAKAS